MEIVSSSELKAVFFDLCASLGPSVIVDVGTRDCDDAVRMKRVSGSSTVFAFEANPENFFELCLRQEVFAHGIQVQHLAISDSIGFARIKIPDYASRVANANLQQRGMGSLLGKSDSAVFVEYDVPQTTLDAFFRPLLDMNPNCTFAFWIDVEGAALQVLAGMSRLLERTTVLKIEVEDREYFKGQALAPEVLELMRSRGWLPTLSSDQTPGQYELLFLNSELRERYAVLAKMWEPGSVSHRNEVPSESEGHLKPEMAVAGAVPLNDIGIVRSSIDIYTLGGKCQRFIGDCVGNASDPTQIEAFSIRPEERIAPREVEYKAFGPEGRETPWISNGEICGFRGRPIIGFAVRLRGDARERFQVVYQASFPGGKIIGPFRDGQPCAQTGTEQPIEMLQFWITGR